MNAFQIYFIGQILLNGLLLLLLWKSTRKGSPLRKIFAVIVGLVLALFIGFYIVRWQLDLAVLKYVLRIFNGYYVALVMFIFWLLVGFLLVEVARLLKLFRSKEQVRKARGVAFLVMIPVMAVLLTWGYHNTMKPIVKHYHVEVEGEKEEQLKLVLVTDTHIGEIIGVENMELLADMVQAESPDYVLMGGDIFDYLLEYAHFPGMAEALDRLHPEKNHIIYVLGNHEHYHKLEEKKQWLRERGVLLVDSVMPLTEQVWLIGRDDDTNDDRASLGSLVAQVPDDAVKLLLAHQPTHMEEVRENRIDLSMHGHTHRGQVIPFRWLVEMKFARAYGHYQKNDHSHHIVSSGFGVSTAPFRIGSRAEIVVIHLTIRPSHP